MKIFITETKNFFAYMYALVNLLLLLFSFISFLKNEKYTQKWNIYPLSRKRNFNQLWSASSHKKYTIVLHKKYGFYLILKPSFISSYFFTYLAPC